MNTDGGCSLKIIMRMNLRSIKKVSDYNNCTYQENNTVVGRFFNRVYTFYTRYLSKPSWCIYKYFSNKGNMHYNNDVLKIVGSACECGPKAINCAALPWFMGSSRRADVRLTCLCPTVYCITACLSCCFHSWICYDFIHFKTGRVVQNIIY